MQTELPTKIVPVNDQKFWLQLFSSKDRTVYDDVVDDIADNVMDGSSEQKPKLSHFGFSIRRLFRRRQEDELPTRTTSKSRLPSLLNEEPECEEVDGMARKDLAFPGVTTAVFGDEWVVIDVPSSKLTTSTSSQSSDSMAVTDTPKKKKIDPDNLRGTLAFILDYVTAELRREEREEKEKKMQTWHGSHSPKSSSPLPLVQQANTWSGKVSPLLNDRNYFTTDPATEEAITAEEQCVRITQFLSSTLPRKSVEVPRCHRSCSASPENDSGTGKSFFHFLSTHCFFLAGPRSVCLLKTMLV